MSANCAVCGTQLELADVPEIAYRFEGGSEVEYETTGTLEYCPVCDLGGPEQPVYEIEFSCPF